MFSTYKKKQYENGFCYSAFLKFEKINKYKIYKQLH